MSVHVESEYGLSKDVRMWGMLSHISALVGLLGNGFGFILGPLIVWLAKREDDHNGENYRYPLTLRLIK